MLAVETTLAKNATKTSNGTVLIRFDILSSHVARRPHLLFGENLGCNGPQFRATRGFIQASLSPAIARPLERSPAKQARRGPITSIVARNKAVALCNSCRPVDFRCLASSSLFDSSRAAYGSQKRIRIVGDFYAEEKIQVTPGPQHDLVTFALIKN